MNRQQSLDNIIITWHDNWDLTVIAMSAIRHLIKEIQTPNNSYSLYIMQQCNYLYQFDNQCWKNVKLSRNKMRFGLYRSKTDREFLFVYVPNM